MSDTPLPNRDIISLFYKKSPSLRDLWIFQCSVKLYQRGSGFSNLVQHLDHKHPEELQAARLRKLPNGQTNISCLLDSKKVLDVHGGIIYVVHFLRPFSVVSSAEIRQHIRYDNMSLNTLMKYMTSLTTQVEANISALLPDRIALVFDEQTTQDAHYVGIFATFPSKGITGYRSVCLELSLLEDESTQDADEHIKFLEFVLNVHSKSLDNVVALIGDNCSTNQSIANKIERPLLGYCSHRFQLAVRQIIDEDAEVIEKVHRLMVKLRTPLVRAKLAKETHLKAKVNNITRWTSTFSMLRRHTVVREAVDKNADEDLDDYVLCASLERKVEKLLGRLEELHDVTFKLQRDHCTLRDTRIYFDSVLEVFQTLEARLEPRARIVHSPLFESALVKIQDQKEGELTISEKRAVRPLLLSTVSTSQQEQVPDSIMERALKRLRAETSQNHTSYLDTRFFLPTSNLCERLFSISGYALTNRRRGILPANLESQCYLFMNRDTWGVDDIKKIIHE